jgi:hypothetical protein
MVTLRARAAVVAAETLTVDNLLHLVSRQAELATVSMTSAAQQMLRMKRSACWGCVGACVHHYPGCSVFFFKGCLLPCFVWLVSRLSLFRCSTAALPASGADRQLSAWDKRFDEQSVY